MYAAYFVDGPTDAVLCSCGVVGSVCFVIYEMSSAEQ